MTIFGFGLEWDCIAIVQQAIKELEKRGYSGEEGKELSMELGFADDGRNAFTVHAYRNKNAVRIIAENQGLKLHISRGILEKKGVDKIVTKTFSSKHLLEASKAFEELLDELDGAIYCNVPEMEKEMAKDELIDRLVKYEREQVARMTKGSKISVASARNQISYSDFVEGAIDNMHHQGYNITQEEGKEYARRWGARI